MRKILTATTLAAVLALSGAAFAQSSGQAASPGGAAASGGAVGTGSTGAGAGTQGGATAGASQGSPGGAGSAPSTAQTPGAIPGPAISPGAQTTGMALTQEQVMTKLTTGGYSNVENVTRDGNDFRARAMQNGRPVDLTIDAYTGTIRSQAAAR